MTSQAQEGGGAVVALDGAFDRAAADRLHEMLLELEPRPVTVDFRRVRVFEDSAVARLAGETSRGQQVALIGLSLHHWRLLRYLEPAHGAGAAS
jgi:STAS domain